MVVILDNFDFSTTDEVTSMELAKSASNFLHQAEYHLAKTVIDQSQTSSKTDHDTKEEVNPIGQKKRLKIMLVSLNVEKS